MRLFLWFSNTVQWLKIAKKSPKMPTQNLRKKKIAFVARPFGPLLVHFRKCDLKTILTHCGFLPLWWASEIEQRFVPFSARSHLRRLSRRIPWFAPRPFPWKCWHRHEKWSKPIIEPMVRGWWWERLGKARTMRWLYSREVSCPEKSTKATFSSTSSSCSHFYIFVFSCCCSSSSAIYFSNFDFSNS